MNEHLRRLDQLARRLHRLASDVDELRESIRVELAAEAKPKRRWGRLRTPGKVRVRTEDHVLIEGVEPPEKRPPWPCWYERWGRRWITDMDALGEELGVDARHLEFTPRFWSKHRERIRVGKEVEALMAQIASSAATSLPPGMYRFDRVEK